MKNTLLGGRKEQDFKLHRALNEAEESDNLILLSINHPPVLEPSFPSLLPPHSAAELTYQESSL